MSRLCVTHAPASVVTKTSACLHSCSKLPTLLESSNMATSFASVFANIPKSPSSFAVKKSGNAPTSAGADVEVTLSDNPRFSYMQQMSAKVGSILALEKQRHELTNRFFLCGRL